MDMTRFEGKVIQDIGLVVDDLLKITFEDGVVLQLEARPSCCENIYFQIDDDLVYYRGTTFTDLKLARWSELSGDDSYSHEISFMDIYTSKGVLSICAHNEHSGWYSGFTFDISLGGVWEGSLCLCG